MKGEEGLFPATYITEAPPAEVPGPPSPVAPERSPELVERVEDIPPDQVEDNGIVATAVAGLGAAAVGVTTVIGKTIGEIETAIESITKPESEDEQELGIGSDTRARLAAQAQLANEARETNRVSGGVAGLVYSDESEDEEEEKRRSLRNGKTTISTLQPAPLMPSTPPMDKPTTPSMHSSNIPSGAASSWNVDDVVQWAKSKGFEEWPKFQEHEISGDLLLELDANLLKELDIPQFGKRLRIAQAISELRRPASISSSQSPASQGMSRGMSAPPNTFQVPISTTPPPSTTPPLSTDSHSRKVSTNSIPVPPMQSIDEITASPSIPPSPVTPSAPKRESFGSIGHRKGKLSMDNKERLSFFGRSRKPAPTTPSETRTATRSTVPQVHQMQPATPQETPRDSSAAALKQIGTPDHSGYMKKKGDRYGWKSRYFVLKGTHLYYLASETVSSSLTRTDP
jgi:hypothetical protein